MIEQNVQWNEEIGDWQLRSVAYTGNNMRKHDPVKDDLDGSMSKVALISCHSFISMTDVPVMYLCTIIL